MTGIFTTRPSDRGNVVDLSNEDFYGPWKKSTKVTVFVNCKSLETEAIFATLNSLLASTFQNMQIICNSVADQYKNDLISWAAEDDRITFNEGCHLNLPEQGFVMFINGGCKLTQYSLESIVRSIHLPGVEVLRCIVDGVPGTLEMWAATWLATQQDLRTAEVESRRLGVERWTTGEALGIHCYTKPAPRIFFRRGSADRHEVDVLVYDFESQKTLSEINNEIRLLRAKNLELKKTLKMPRATSYSRVRQMFSIVIRRMNRTGRIIT